MNILTRSQVAELETKILYATYYASLDHSNQSMQNLVRELHERLNSSYHSNVDFELKVINGGKK